MMRGKRRFLKDSCEQMVQGCQMNPELEVDMRKRWSPGLMSPSSLLHQGPILKSPPCAEAKAAVRIEDRRGWSPHKLVKRGHLRISGLFHREGLHVRMPKRTAMSWDCWYTHGSNHPMPQESEHRPPGLLVNDT